MERLTEKYERLSEQIGEITKKIERQERDYRRLTSEISRLKSQERGLGNRSQLQSLLKESRRRSAVLQKWQNKRTRLKDRLSDVHRRLNTQISKEILQLRNKLRRNAYAKIDSILMRIEKLEDLRERYQLQAHSDDHFREFEAASRVKPQTPQEWDLAADKMRDLKSSMRQYLGKLEDDIQSLRTRKMVQKRARRFDREDRFFDEGSRLSPMVQSNASESGADNFEAETGRGEGTAQGDSGDDSSSPGGPVAGATESADRDTGNDEGVSLERSTAEPTSDQNNNSFDGASQAEAGAGGNGATDQPPPTNSKPKSESLGGDGTSLELIDTLSEERLSGLSSDRWESLSLDQKLNILRERRRKLRQKIEEYDQKAKEFQQKARSLSASPEQ